MSAPSVYNVIIEASLKANDGTLPFWGRMTTDSTTSVLFISSQEAVNAVQAYELTLRSKKKVSLTARSSSSTSLRPIEPCEGDFAGPTPERGNWLSTLNSIRNATVEETYHALKARLIISKASLNSATKSRIRKFFMIILENRSRHELSPLIQECFWV